MIRYRIKYTNSHAWTTVLCTERCTNLNLMQQVTIANLLCTGNSTRPVIFERKHENNFKDTDDRHRVKDLISKERYVVICRFHTWLNY